MFRMTTTQTGTPKTTFQDYLNSYTYPVFHHKGADDTSHRDFVAQYSANPYYTGTKLFLPRGHQSTNDPLVLTSLLHQKPVYWGQDKDELVNWETVERAFGYTKAVTNSHLTTQQVSDTRYAVAGPMRVMAHGAGDDHVPEWDAHAVHIWAPNLESTQTADYDSIINMNTKPNPKDDIEWVRDDPLWAIAGNEHVYDLKAINNAYYDRFYEMWELIFHSSTDGLATGQTAWVQSALLGAGCFLKGCPEVLRNELLNTQYQAVHDALQAQLANPERKIHLKMCIYTPQDFPDEVVQLYSDLATSCDHFSVGVGRAEGNVLANLPRGDDSIRAVVVNAGDPLSFIGNGQSKDFTVEGFLVANAGGFNPQLRNTSFLHNTRFNPHLLVSENWVRMSA